MDLIIKTIKGKGATYRLFDVNQLISISDLKTKIEERTNVKVNQQILIYKGTKLIGYRLLLDYIRLDNEPPIIYLVSRTDTIKVYVKLVSGGIINLFLNAEESIGEVKKEVERRKHDNVEANQQRLVFKGITLNDNGTLSDYEIKNNSTIEVFLNLSGGSDNEINDINNNKISNDSKDYMYRKANSWHQKLDSIKIKSLLDENKNEILIENIGNFEKISELKKRILKQGIKLVKDSILIYNGQILKESMKLFNYEITNNSIIYVNLGSEIQIFIDIESKRNHILININTTKYVHELKKLIEFKIKDYHYDDYYFGGMNLIYEDDKSDIELEDDKILLFYNIKNESIINLFRKPLNIQMILLDNCERKIIYLDVKPNDTIKNLKMQLQDQFKSNEYDIIYDGKITNDNQTLLNYEIKCGSKFLIRARNDNKIKIRIKHLNISKTTLLESNSSIITIDEIKRMYQTKERKPVDYQTLFNDRKQTLENEHLLNEYFNNIKDEVIIYLVLNR